MLLMLITFGPFVAYVLLEHLKTDYRTLLQLLSYVGVVFILIFKRRENLVFPWYLVLYLFFTIWEFYVDLHLLERKFRLIYLFKNPLIGGLNFAFIIENLPLKSKYYQKILKYSRYILISAVILIVLQQALNANLFMAPTVEDDKDTILKSDNDNRLYSIYSWIGTGGMLATGLGFVPIFLIVLEEIDKRNGKIFIWLLMGLAFAFLTKGRWIMVNTILVFFLIFINHRDRFMRFMKLLIIIPAVVFISSTALKSVGIDLMGIVNDRILEKNKKFKVASTRLLAFKTFNLLFWDKPFIGHGDWKYGGGMEGTGYQRYNMVRITKGRSSQIHVGYLSLLYRYGIIGAVFFLGFLFLLLRRMYNNVKITGMWSPFLGVLGFALANLTLVSFVIFETGILIALIADRYYMQRALNKNQIDA